MSRQRTPFNEVIKGFRFKYGKRNPLFVHSRYEATALLNLAILNMSKMIRKDESSRQTHLTALASILSRSIAYANSYGDLDIVGAMSIKYPIDHCAYCGSIKCSCEYEERKTIVESEASEVQRKWSIEDWCRHLDKVYGEVNRSRGISTAFHRLQEEFCEVSAAEFVHSRTPSATSREYRNELAKEFADVFAWIFAISNMENLNVGGIIKAWAFKPCGECAQNPCECGPDFFETSKA